MKQLGKIPPDKRSRQKERPYPDKKQKASRSLPFALCFLSYPLLS